MLFVYNLLRATKCKFCFKTNKQTQGISAQGPLNIVFVPSKYFISFPWGFVFIKLH